MSWVRLRQVALVAADLDHVVGELHEAFGLEVGFRDPGVARFGLHNAVLPVGNQFIEVVAPTQEGTAAGRQLERLRGDGGYMVICHTDDHAGVRRRVDALGVRTVVDVEDHGGYRIMQLHPSDTGGSFLEIDWQPGGEDPAGPWAPAGEDWQGARRTGVVNGITAVEVQTRDPERTAERWAAVTGCTVADGALALGNATVRFVEGTVDSLVAVELTATESTRRGERQTVCGVRMALG